MRTAWLSSGRPAAAPQHQLLWEVSWACKGHHHHSEAVYLHDNGTPGISICVLTPPGMYVCMIHHANISHVTSVRGMLHLLDGLVLSAAAPLAELRRLSFSGVLSSLLRAMPLTALLGMHSLMLLPPAAYNAVSPTFLRRPGDLLASEGISKWLLCVAPGRRLACTGCAVRPSRARSACCGAFLL